MRYGGESADEDKVDFCENQPINNIDQVIHGFSPWY
jgi:hypothetical protein